MEEKNLSPENERRRTQRFRGGVIVEYDVIEGEASKKEISLKPAMIRDIGLGGVSIFVHEELHSGARIILKLYSVHFNEPVVAVGTVVWSRKAQLPHKGAKDFFDIGIEFFELDRKNQSLLQRMIEVFHSLERKPDSDARPLF